MREQALRNAPIKLAAVLLAAASSFILGSCGGGGASSTTEGGQIIVQPEVGTFYAGVPSIITVTGGRQPYTMSSSDPTVLPVPQTLNGSTITVVPNNPGVVDVGLQPGEVPRRTVTVTARDANAQFEDASISVLQNFFTGYGSTVSALTQCTPLASPTAQACPGRDSIITVTPISQGTLYGGRNVRFQVIRGNFQFVVPETPSNPTRVLSNDYTIPTDHTGTAIARITVPVGAPSQLATYRITDVQTGAYVDSVFTISAASSTLVAIPDEITLTGNAPGRCGTGTAQVFIYDGIPPYSAVSTAPAAVTVIPESPNSQPGVFTVAALNSGICGTFTVIFTDANGSRVNVTVNTETGTGTTPTLAVAPATMTLVCGTSGNASVVGGSGSYSATSSHPRVTASVSGNTVTVTRANGDGATVYPTTATVSVTDGAAIQSITVTVPANCP